MLKPLIMNIKKAADFLKVHRTTINRWIKNGTLPYVNLSGRRVIRTEDAENFKQKYD